MTKGADVRLAAPAIGVWAVMWVVTGWDWGMWVLVAACVLSVSCIGIRVIRSADVTPAAAIALIVLTSGTIIGGMRVAVFALGPLAAIAEEGRVVDALVRVGDVRSDSQWGSVVVRASVSDVSFGDTQWTLRQPVEIHVPASDADEWGEIPAGAVVRITARLSATEWSDGLAASMRALTPPEVIRPPPLWQRIIESMRAGVSEAMRWSTPDQASLLPALVVGDTSAISSTMEDDFRATGLTHLMAVSGANLAIMLSFLGAGAKAMGVRGRGLTVVSVVGIAVFIALCHQEPSVLRAAAMGAVVLISVGKGRGGLRALSLAVMLLCWLDPWMSRSVGFALSVLACLGIMLWGSVWAAMLGRWLPTWASEAIAVPLSAQIATQPVVCWLSGTVSVSGLLSNAAAGPWVGPATVVGLLAAFSSPVSSLVASCLGYVAGWCAQPILLIAHGFGSLPGASYPWPSTPVSIGLLSLSCLMVAWAMPMILRKRAAVLATVTAMVAAVMTSPIHPGWPGESWRMAACDVGQGDAFVVRVAAGQVILMDTGPPDSGVVGCLDSLGVTDIPVIVLSHFHVDHVGGLPEVLRRFPVGEVIMPVGGAGSKMTEELVSSHGVHSTRASGGERVVIGDTQVRVISAYRSSISSTDGEESSAENDESLIVRVDTAEASFLGTGDVEVLGQQAALVDVDGLRVDVLKVSHHGSSRQDTAFLEATGAGVALIGVGQDNGYGHPTTSCLKKLTSLGMQVVRTDEHGSIALAWTPDLRITATR